MSWCARKALCEAALIMPLLVVFGYGGAGTPSGSGSGGSVATRHERYWVLTGVKRDFYICATAGRRDWRTALCVFDSRTAAEEHLRSLGEAQVFLDTLERYGASIPEWMRRDPLLPEVHEVPARELHQVLWSIGVEYVTLNPPPAGERVEALEFLSAEAFPQHREAGSPDPSPTDPNGSGEPKKRR